MILGLRGTEKRATITKPRRLTQIIMEKWKTAKGANKKSPTQSTTNATSTSWTTKSDTFGTSTTFFVSSRWYLFVALAIQIRLTFECPHVVNWSLYCFSVSFFDNIFPIINFFSSIFNFNEYKVHQSYQKPVFLPVPFQPEISTSNSNSPSFLQFVLQPLLDSLTVFECWTRFSK